MAIAVKITTVGNSAGIVLPKEILSHLNVEKGDTLFVTKTQDGIQLVACEENFATQMDAARKVMRENRDVLRKLPSKTCSAEPTNLDPAASRTRSARGIPPRARRSVGGPRPRPARICSGPPSKSPRLRPAAATLERLAAAYAFGIAANHPFADGNKRTALVASITFLLLNGLRLTADKPDRYQMFYGLAAGEVSEESLAQWLTLHTETV